MSQNPVNTCGKKLKPKNLKQNLTKYIFSHDGKKGKNDPVYTVTLPPTSLPPGSMIHPISTVSNSKSKMFASMKSIQVDSEAAIATDIIYSYPLYLTIAP